ncbi:hypothetical protein D4Z93_03005 [Clostridium fermenticellae]|uniref:Uncharacterized protein n=1 Tax=Clostridium fermenticellae TaxID=2068654 RepID=A0A386H1M6_9CLOT|nr:hypothetical protein [Clostridium fermenticellae]AYD39564.1 hypothetical protein D4Z93_03005 [Clostridium fermenticellae]
MVLCDLAVGLKGELLINKGTLQSGKVMDADFVIMSIEVKIAEKVGIESGAKVEDLLYLDLVYALLVLTTKYHV